MDADRWARLEALLARGGPLPAAVLGRELGLSQPSISRLLAEAGDRIVRIGRARATRYALAHPIGRAGSHWPLYRIDEHARAERLGELYALRGGGYWFETSAPRPALMHGDFADGVFPGLPWFLDDQRPQDWCVERDAFALKDHRFMQAKFIKIHQAITLLGAFQAHALVGQLADFGCFDTPKCSHMVVHQFGWVIQSKCIGLLM